jgi:purine-nucleoside phosphorylase
MPTPHIAAGPGEIAPAVIMPGDPRRARRIAEQLLDDPRLVTEVRDIPGFTGRLRGRPVTVMASGMGAPSISIYATELFRFYGVERIVRVGTAGALTESLRLGDVVVASAAHTDSSLPTVRMAGVSLSLAPSPRLLYAAMAAAPAARVGPVFSSDHFYLSRPTLLDALSEVGTLAVEMEAAGLYSVAAAEGREALTIVTISDHIRTGEEMPAELRESQYEAALDVAVSTLLARS